ncbi:MAG: FecR domain-containing protein, partial [Chthoniobacterales bacterium]
MNCFAAEAPIAGLSRASGEVKVSAPGNASRAVKTGEALPNGAAVRTGAEGEAEITLAGPSIARLGGKTTLTLAGQGRELELGEGLVLFSVPRSAGAAKIKTGAINLDPRGSTGLMERNGPAYVKILMLEGEARVYTSRLGESIVVTAGQLLITGP